MKVKAGPWFLYEVTLYTEKDKPGILDRHSVWLVVDFRRDYSTRRQGAACLLRHGMSLAEVKQAFSRLLDIAANYRTKTIKPRKKIIKPAGGK